MKGVSKERSKFLIGSVFIPRKIVGSTLWFEHPTKLKLYLYFALMVNHADNGRFHKGEHVTSYARIMEETSMNRNTISKCLKWLKKEKYSIVGHRPDL